MKKHIVVVSNLYPNRDEPNRGIFIKQLTENLIKHYEISVVSPIPWRPTWWYLLKGINPLPKHDIVSGVNVYYPRHVVIPKVLRSTYGWLMQMPLSSILTSIQAKKNIDLISAHWVYPDGFAAVNVAKRLGIPVTVHALGCDINEYTKYRFRRHLISKTLIKSDRIVVKSDDLAEKARDLGGVTSKIRTILNGVDKRKFYPMDMMESRSKLGLSLSEEYLLFVGNLQEEKGLMYLIKALAITKNFKGKLLIIGTGPLEESFRKQVDQLDLNHKVEFFGSVSHSSVPVYLSAVNALCLPSLREGCPNIVLESLSCATPVLATRVGAVPQMITNDKQGMIVPCASSIDLANAIPNIMKLKGSTAFHFNWYSWEDNADKISDVYKELIG
jgi:teichuronic acid biosynthesis glycosyltransferase TuaC